MDQVRFNSFAHYRWLPWPEYSRCGLVYYNSHVRLGSQGHGAASETKGLSELLFHLSRDRPCVCFLASALCLTEIGAHSFCRHTHLLLLGKTGGASLIQSVSSGFAHFLSDSLHFRRG